MWPSLQRAVKARFSGSSRQSTMRRPQLGVGQRSSAPHPSPHNLLQRSRVGACLRFFLPPWIFKGTWGTFLCFPQRLWPCAHEGGGVLFCPPVSGRHLSPDRNPQFQGNGLVQKDGRVKRSGLDPQTWPLLAAGRSCLNSSSSVKEGEGPWRLPQLPHVETS